MNGVGFGGGRSGHSGGRQDGNNSKGGGAQGVNGNNTNPPPPRQEDNGGNGQNCRDVGKSAYREHFDWRYGGKNIREAMPSSAHSKAMPLISYYDQPGSLNN